MAAADRLGLVGWDFIDNTDAYGIHNYHYWAIFWQPNRQRLTYLNEQSNMKNSQLAVIIASGLLFFSGMTQAQDRSASVTKTISVGKEIGANGAAQTFHQKTKVGNGSHSVYQLRVNAHAPKGTSDANTQGLYTGEMLMLFEIAASSM